MLMMGFFVILWVLKPAAGENGGNSKKAWMDAVISIRDGFGYLPDPESKDPIDIEMILRKIQASKVLRGPGHGGETTEPKDGAEGTDDKVTTIRMGNQSTVGGRLLFEIGDAALTKESRDALTEIAAQIRGHKQIVLVKGHTSLDDFNTATPQQQMDLSLRRAQAAADFLTAHGVSPEILRVQGCSTFEPVRQRAYTSDSQARNRRVEVQVSSTLVDEFQDAEKTPATKPATPTGEAQKLPQRP